MSTEKEIKYKVNILSRTEKKDKELEKTHKKRIDKSSINE